MSKPSYLIEIKNIAITWVWRSQLEQQDLFQAQPQLQLVYSSLMVFKFVLFLTLSHVGVP